MSGERIKVTGGPWPERIGCAGSIVADPGDGVYPFSRGRRPHEVVILLDEDPLTDTGPRWWTCCIDRADVSAL